MPHVLVAYLTLALLLLAVGIAMHIGIAYLLARSLVTPPRMSDGKAAWVLKRLSPGDLDLRFEEVGFDIRDARTHAPLRIAAWWIPNPNAGGNTVVFLHGYADAKVGSIAWAPTWHALGWNILSIDLRAHGESGGRFCTGGYFERQDVLEVLHAIRAQRPGQTRRVVLFGASFGAAVAAVTAALPDAGVDALVLDSPVPDFAEGAMLQMGRLGAPGGSVRRLAVRWAERLSGARFNDVRLLDVLPTLQCPVLIIAPENDLLLEAGRGQALRAAMAARSETAGPTQYWHVEEAGHLMALPADPVAYRKRISNFLASLP